MGYRYNFTTGQIVKTGIIRLDPIPKNCQIFLDGDKINNKDNKTTIEIPDLKPGNYKVEITNEMYQRWEKNITVEANKITNENNILLLPKSIEKKDIAEITIFSLNPSKEYLAFFNINQLQILNFLSEKTLSFPKIKIQNTTKLNWLSNNIIALIDQNNDTTQMQTLDIDNGNIVTKTLPLKFDSIKILGSFPLQPSIIIFSSEDKIYYQDLTQNYNPIFWKEKILTSAINNNTLFYVTNDNPEQLITETLTINTQKKYHLDNPLEKILKIINHVLIYQDAAGITHIIDLDSNSKSNINFEPQDILLNTGQSFLATTYDNEIIKINLLDFTTNTPIRLSQQIDSAYWLDDNNLIFSSTNYILRSNINGELQQKIIELANNKKIFIQTGNREKILIVINDNDQYLLSYIYLQPNNESSNNNFIDSNLSNLLPLQSVSN